MSYLYCMSVASGGETRHAATNKAVPVMHTGNSCRGVRCGLLNKQSGELFVNGRCPSRPGRPG